MDNPNDPSNPGTPIQPERWSIAHSVMLNDMFRLLAIPLIPGYTPAAITAVGVMVSPEGKVARYPVYGQLAGAGLSGLTEVRAAIATLQPWLRMQKQRQRHGNN